MSQTTVPYHGDCPEIVVMLACNDHRNGLPTGKCDAVQFLTDWQAGAPVLKLDGGPWRCRLIADTDRVWPDGGRYEGVLQFGRLALPWKNATSWVGNWCWEAVTLAVEQAAILVATLCASPRWGLEAAAMELYDAWVAGLQDAGQWEVLLRSEREKREVA